MKCAVLLLRNVANETPKLQADARRIHVSNATHAAIDPAIAASAANIATCDEVCASIAKYTAPMAATPAAFAICAVVP
jgi:hypothetical protein